MWWPEPASATSSEPGGPWGGLHVHRAPVVVAAPAAAAEVDRMSYLRKVEADSVGLAVWTSAGLAAAAGALVDLLILASQYTLRGDVSPVLPPLALWALVMGLIVGGITVPTAMRSQRGPWGVLALALMSTTAVLVGIFVLGALLSSADIGWTLIWAGPIALVVMPSTVVASVALSRGARRRVVQILVPVVAAVVLAVVVL